MWPFYRSLRVLIPICLFCSSVVSRAQSKPHINDLIRIDQVVSIPAIILSKDTSLTFIQLSVGDLHDSIWIPNYGFLPANRDLAFLTNLVNLTLYKKDKRTVVTTFSLSNPTFLQGNSAFDVPPESDFPAVGRLEKINDSRSFDDKAREVLNNVARVGALRDEHQNQVKISTPLIPLSLQSPSHFNGYAAFILKYDLSRPLYEIKVLAEESLASDPERRIAQSAEVKNAAIDLLQKIINELK